MAIGARSADHERHGGGTIRQSESHIELMPAPHVLRDYALLADGCRGALVGPQGDVAWMCFPTWSDPALFASLIGSGGHYTVQPVGRRVWGGFYVDGSLVWTSRWVTKDGTYESQEALVYPGQPNRAVLLRRVQAVDADGAVVVVLDPRADYGRRSLGYWVRGDACWHLRGPDIRVRWWGAPEAAVREDGGHRRLELDLHLRAGEHRDLVLEIVTAAAGQGETGSPDAESLWSMTTASWASAVPPRQDVVAAEDVRRSYAVLRGLTGPQGGTVAAATTSLPECADANRNYDYRYVWVRDTCYVGHAGAALPDGLPMLDDATRWVTERLLADGHRLAPAYTTLGEKVPEPHPLDLPAHPGGNNVVGNRIGDPFQLDVFGEALLLLAEAASLDRLDATGWRAADVAARAIEERWSEPDSGIWELDLNWWAHSRLTCIAGLRAICRAGAPTSWIASRLGLADAIATRTAISCVHPSGRWQRAPDDPRVDSALLLAQIRGAVTAADPRSVGTRRAVAEELARDGYLYRWAHGPAELGEDEGSFIVCNFWMALACLQAGDSIEAVRWFERARSSAGSPGLLSEAFDVTQHQLRGNLPQAFVHAALIESASAQSGDVTRNASRHGPER
jgi:hypothetical protein